MSQAHLSQYARIGSEKTGFVSAKQFGPGGCAHCRHNAAGICKHPEVKRDPSIPSDHKRNADGFVEVEPKDRCEFFQPKHKPKSPASKAGMRG